MAKTFRINEDALRNIVREAVKKKINEISYGTVDDAYYKGMDFDSLYMAFDSFYSELGEIDCEKNPYLMKVKGYADAINAILSRKADQNRNFMRNTLDVDNSKYYSDNDDDIEGQEMQSLRQNYGRRNR